LKIFKVRLKATGEAQQKETTFQKPQIIFALLGMKFTENSTSLFRRTKKCIDEICLKLRPMKMSDQILDSRVASFS